MQNYAYLLKSNPRAELARRNFRDFVLYTKPDYKFNWHHEVICAKLQAFERGEIKKLMLFVPPQHGKSELATRRLPAYMLGKVPTRKMAICSYSATLASSFNRDIQRVMDTDIYHDVFPDAQLNESNVVTTAQGSWLRNSEVFEIVNHGGFVKTVGVGGPLTGTPIDIGIIDDPVKDRVEAESPAYASRVWSWYTDVFETRLHNGSQQLIIMTRWSEGDLAGRLLARDNDWEVIKFEAIKTHNFNYDDPREDGEALWADKHSLERLEKVRENNPYTFNSLYQQTPMPDLESRIFVNFAENQQFPTDYQWHGYGLDFGFTNDPTGLIEVCVSSGELYLRELIYESALTNGDISARMESLGISKQSEIVCDSAEPKSIEELYRLGWNVHPAIKGADSIIHGIDTLKRYKLNVCGNSTNLARELRAYRWKTDRNGKALNVPIDTDNHLIDALRYIVTYKLKPKIIASQGGALV